MKPLNKILLFAVLFSTNSYSLEKTTLQFEGNWKGSYCSSYNDGLSQGTYNYKFNSSGRVDSYIEYYTDLSCQTKIGTIDYQITGTYKIKDSSRQNDTYTYNLEVKLNHLNYPVFFKIKVKNDSMTLCWNDTTRCSNLTKIKD